MSELYKGAYGVVTRDLGSSFLAGDQVLIEEVDPDPDRPEYKYLVLSFRDQTRYRLSDADLTAASPEMSQPVKKRSAGKGKTKKPKEPKKKRNTAKVLLVILLLILFAAGGFFAGRLTYEPKTKTVERTVVKRIPAEDPFEAINAYLKKEGVVSSGMSLSEITSTSDPDWRLYTGTGLTTGTLYFLMHEVDNEWKVVDYSVNSVFTADRLNEAGAPDDLTPTSQNPGADTSP